MAGVAALVLATLASVDGNLLRATQVKGIVASTGDYSASLIGKTASSSRANAASAVLAALRVDSAYGALVPFRLSVRPTVWMKPLQAVHTWSDLQAYIRQCVGDCLQCSAMYMRTSYLQFMSGCGLMASCVTHRIV